MNREVERKAFAKAWSYLSYRSAAKWSALAAALGTGLLYVGLLIVLGLFADLMVYRGQVAGFRDLPPSSQLKFQQDWLGLTMDERKQRLRDLGVDDQNIGHLAGPDLNTSTPDQQASFWRSLPLSERALLWRSQICWLLKERVGGAAGVAVLPSFHELPGFVQAAFAQQWRPPDQPLLYLGSPHAGFPAALPWGELLADSLKQPALATKIAENAALLERLGVDAAQAREWAASNLLSLEPKYREFIWRAVLYDKAQNRRSNHSREISSEQLLALHKRASPELLQPARADEISRATLPNHGLLSLVVRTETHHGFRDRFYGPILGTLAHWNPWMWKYGNRVYLTGMLVLALLLLLLRGTLIFVQQEMAARATLEAAMRLRRAIYHHTFRLGTLAIRALGPSEAVSVFARHVEAVHDALHARLTVYWREPFKFGLLLAFALAVQFWLALAFLVLAILVWLAAGQVAIYFKRRGRRATNQATEQITLLRESLMLMRLVKVYLMELFNQARVERQLAGYAVAQQERFRGEAISRSVLRSLGVLAAVVLLYIAGLSVFQGHLGVPSAITLATALISLYWPLQAWLENRKLLRRGRESAAIVFHFLARPGEVGQAVGAEFLQPLAKQLQFDKVSLREPGTTRMLLQEVSFAVQAGQRVALVGPDDLEKQALAYLIPRYLDPTEGEIRMDGHDLRWVTLDSLRVQIAIVLQNNLVFHDTVANNIGCGDTGYTMPQIVEAAKIAHAHHFIQKLPRGYDTPIGELGHPLNPGEQFRIGLARAILRDPALLIIEEPALPLGNDTKDLLDDTFARLLPGRTTIFLPHRRSTIKSCDRVLLLHKGRLEGVGDHRELLANNALYRHFHYLEFSEVGEQG